MRSLTLKEAGDLLQVSRQTLLAWLSSGKITGYQVGNGSRNLWLVDPLEIEQLRIERRAEVQEKLDKLNQSVYEYLGVEVKPS